MSGFRVGQWVYSGRHWYAWLGNTRVVDEDDYRRLRSQMVWQAIQAIISVAYTQRQGDSACRQYAATAYFNGLEDFFKYR